MLGKKIINTGSVACTTDTTQILDGGTTQSTALYRFEDNANDTASSTGKFNKGGIFNGTSSRINLSNNPINGLSSVSFSFWLKPSDIARNQYVLSFINSVGGWNGLGVRISTSGKIQLVRANNGAVTSTENSTTSLSLNVWQHIAFTVQQSSTVIYINGSEDGTFSNTPFTTNNTGSFDIGMNEYSPGVTQAYTDGSIDQVRIFNKVISASEVTTLYNETTTTVNTLQVLGDTSCVAAYTFEGNANDLSTNYNGTASNVIYDYNGTASNVTYATGKFDKAAVFNGSSSYISADNPNSGGGARSFSAWIKTTSTGFQSIITNGGASHASGLNMFVYNNKLYSTSGKGNGENYGPTSSADVNTGDWVHCALTMSGTAIGSTLKTYVNGTLDGTHTTTILITDTYDAFRIGGRYVNGSYVAAWFNGSIDQVRIFNKALSPGEINSLYNETTTTAALGTISNPSTVAYYKMQDATDETGSYNGTATNVDFNVQGKYGFAGKFNGSSSKIEVSNQVIPNGATSISFWYNPQGSTGTEYILGQGVATASKGPTVYWHSQSFGALVAKGTSSLAGSATGSTTYSTTAFHHVVFTWDGTSNSNAFKVYVNGSLLVQGTSDTSSSSIGSYTNFAIGGLNGSTFAEGRIDQVRIFNKVISADEVTKLYNEIQCADTITTPENYFNTVLYTGNATSRSITTTFQPDFVWLKSRGSNRNHRVFDSVRGATKGLYSDLANAEYTENSLTAFNANGFTLGTAGNQNVSSEDYVSWNWKAPLANLSTAFNGSSSKIVLPTLSSDFVGANSRSVSAWVKITSTPSGSLCIFNSGNAATLQSFGYFVGTSKEIIISYYNKNWVTSETISLGNWNHIVFTYNGGAVETSSNSKVYINGTLATLGSATGSATGSANTSNANHAIGVYNATSQYFFNGSIGQVRIFNDVLTTSEISDLYAEPAASNNTLNYPAGAGCVASYPLQTNAVDLSGNYSGTDSNVTFSQPGYLTGNTDGTIASSVAANAEAGFSIVSYTGTSTIGDTIGHGLGTPDLIIVKNRDNSSASWAVWSSTFSAASETLFLDLTSPSNQYINRFGTVNSTTFQAGSSGGTEVNASGNKFVAYIFKSVAGYQRIGSYVGNGSTNGPSVYTGFEPAWIMIKRTDAAGAWNIFDNKRNSTNPRNSILQADKSDQEYTNTNYNINFYANGFQFLNSTADWNASNGKYIFMAIAANPDTTAPTEANSFKTKIFSANNSSQSITGLGFKPDFVWTKSRTNAYNHSIYDSIRGVNKLIQANTTNVQSSLSNAFNSFDSDGFTLGSGDNSNSGSGNSVAWAWKGLDHDRNLSSINTDGSIPSIVSANPAAGFSIVSLDKPNTNTDTYGHGLSSVPEMIILKRTASSDDWHVYHKDLGNTVRISLNSNAAKVTGTGVWASTTPTASLFTLQNQTGGAHIAYCFHSVAGYSKVAYYTGTGSAFNVTLGFTPGWVLIKRADGVGSWTIFDNQRSNGFGLSPDDNYGSASGGYDYSSIIQLSGTGAAGKIEHLGASATLNTAGNKYIYLAFSA